ncbi:MAG: tripartite tricarboxylate transporter substrate binding protein [Hyphomicrobiales bacterium]|nr:tripartite tricarboxylate transporter substrate binding protein [Hyphomicrobiales bacterium]
MTLLRRQFLQLAAGAAALPLASHIAGAQSYPTRPVRIVVGFPSGSAPDIVARLIGQSLSERLGQPFVVENRPGASSNIATEAVVRAEPDGYALLMVSLPNVFNASLYDKLSFDFLRDIVAVASIDRQPFILETHPSLPAKTVPELIAYAKANPGKINMASAGIGSAPHVFGELFKTMAGVDMLHVPYRGNPIPDLLSGQMQVFFGPVQSGIEHIRAGRLRALAVTTATRSEAMPDIPPLGDSVPGYEASAWLGIGAPKGTPRDIVERLNREINASLATAEMKARFAGFGDAPFASSPADFGKLLADETEKWGKVIRSANIKAE